MSASHLSSGLPTRLTHLGLRTTFCGTEHRLSSSDIPIHQYLGIKYATIPARFSQSKLCTSYPPIVDASKHGSICPQIRPSKSSEETLFGLTEDEIPNQTLEQDEFECLNLNITCPGGLNPSSAAPVMLWFHGGGDRGSGSEWFYDAGPIVRKSMEFKKAVIVVTFNFRIGLLGFATNPIIRDDNKTSGDDGSGNYGLRDQRKANEWLRHHISEFGGDPLNITLFGSGTGAADIVCHLLSRANAEHPIFHRSIIQSAVFEPTLPDVNSAGWLLSRVMSALQVSSIEKFRHVPVGKLLGMGQTLRAVDDGFFFREGWQSYLGKEGAHARSHHRRSGHHDEVEQSRAICIPVKTRTHLGVMGAFLHPPLAKSKSRSRSKSALRKVQLPSRATPLKSSTASTSSIVSEKISTSTLQPLIIGDCSSDSLLWSSSINLWTSAAVVRRLKAICQSMSKTNTILHAYDISSYTPDDEIVERVLELVNDARIAWPTQCIADNAAHERGNKGVWRYVFDQEGPSRGVPHHAADLMYLFDTVPLPAKAFTDVLFDGHYDSSDDEDTVPYVSRGSGSPFHHAGAPEQHDGDSSDRRGRSRGGSFSSHLAAKCESISFNSSPSDRDYSDHDEWMTCPVDAYSYYRVRDAMQEKWISFAHGEVPWRNDKVFVFGPEGETGERSKEIFEGRRRCKMWKEALEPLGPILVQKCGVELSRGPSLGADRI